MNKLLLFASIAEKLNERELQINSNGLTVGQLRTKLMETYPQIQHELEHAFFAVNENLVTEATVIEPGDTIAVMPPVSGG